MKQKWLFFSALMLVCHANAQQTHERQDIPSDSAVTVSPENVLAEYPRPNMVRPEWENLNGLWRYAITPKDADAPDVFDGDILVPFCAESLLSGVQESVGPDNALWYSRPFSVPEHWDGGRVLLHFGAVDWMTEVWVNGLSVGTHSGGYTPFSFDITSVAKGGNNTLVVRVWDPTDASGIPHGSQTIKSTAYPDNAVTGIWQTVWLEPVPDNYIRNVVAMPRPDKASVQVEIDFSNPTSDLSYRVEVMKDGETVAVGKTESTHLVEVNMPENFLLWTPDHPFLYDLKVTVLRNDSVIDAVDGYFAMRCFGTQREENGFTRLTLNGKPIFLFGPNDHGWWPDGLYTAPDDEALSFDVQCVKNLGFNMIRKNDKVEPARWYYHCDRIGLIVWQDMPGNGQTHDSGQSVESEGHFVKEWKEIVHALRSVPCIGIWMPFDEDWGLSMTAGVVEMTKHLDSSRLVNPGPGGRSCPCGDILDLSHAGLPVTQCHDPNRAMVLGHGRMKDEIDGHVETRESVEGEEATVSVQKASDAYVEEANRVYEMLPQGISAVVFMQTTDSATDANGLMSYDRKELKYDKKRLFEINRKISHALAE